MRVRSALASITVAACLVVAAGVVPAHAATVPINNATVDPTTSWTHFTNNRVSTMSTISFQPSNLLLQVASPAVSALTLRLNNTSNAALSSETHWTNTMPSKTLISGIATGVTFRLGAKGYSSVTGDRQFSGTLTF
ncbi:MULTISPECIES: hypothetical protein [unclassified Salinibacterium]|uniref:hypothetical protein n=1 Tax=unclassified Salinibacterium TaxID=2632331 RepID=UPI0014224490|nr:MULTISPECIES: hypothetical protein [unclassified Salinibacterium]